jgi:hypothetical protein
MAAPSPPNPPHPEEKPKQEAGVPIELWGLKFTIPLPKPAVLFLTGLVLLAAAFLVYTKAIQPALANYVVRSKAEWMELRKKAAERDSLLPTVQRDEFEKHFGQSPSATHRAPKEIELDYFDDDGAILFVRTISGLPPVRYWFVDLSKMPLSGLPHRGWATGEIADRTRCGR